LFSPFIFLYLNYPVRVQSPCPKCYVDVVLGKVHLKAGVAGLKFKKRGNNV